MSIVYFFHLSRLVGAPWSNSESKARSIVSGVLHISTKGKKLS